MLDTLDDACVRSSLAYLAARSDEIYTCIRLPNAKHPSSRAAALDSTAHKARLAYWIHNSYSARSDASRIAAEILLTYSPTLTMAKAFEMCHPIICFCVHTLLTSQDYIQYIHEPYIEEQSDDHYESKCGEQLRAELGLEWTPSMQRLINSLAILTLSYTVRLIHRTTEDDPDSVVLVSSQRPQLFKHM